MLPELTDSLLITLIAGAGLLFCPILSWLLAAKVKRAYR